MADREALAGLRVRALREERGWTQQQLAEACERAGLSSMTRSTVAKVESGLRKLTSGEIRVLARVLDIEATDLLGAAVGPVRRIFLCFAGEDSDVAGSISDWFRAEGIEVFDWMAPRQRGRRFIEEIENGILSAEAFIALLSPRFLASDWCRREVEMAIQREGSLRSLDPAATFINVVNISHVRPVDAGMLGGYDWLDMTTMESRQRGLYELSRRFGSGTQQTHDAAPDAGGIQGSGFRDRAEDLRRVLNGLTSTIGPHFWLVIAPPQLGKTWLLDRIANDPSLSERPAWIVRKVDVRSEPPDVLGNAAALLTRLFELPNPTTTVPETLRSIAQAILRSGRPHLCLLDSAELLSGETAVALRSCMSQIYNLVQNNPRKGARLAFVIASRQQSPWQGIFPRPALSVLPLDEFNAEIVRQALQDVFAEMDASFSAAEIRKYAQLVHQLTEGLPALLARCLRWIRIEEGVEMERLQTRELFEQLAYPYIKEELLTPESLLPPGQRRVESTLRALMEAYRVLVPYRFFTQSHLRYHRESDTRFHAAIDEACWEMTDLWTALSGTPLLRRPLDEPWQQIHSAIRRLLYRYFYSTDEECLDVHNEARKFVEIWTEGQVGTEQVLGMLECLWHEAIALGLSQAEEREEVLVASARRLSGALQGSPAYLPPELRAFAVDRMQNDEELQEAVGNANLFARLIEVVANPSD